MLKVVSSPHTTTTTTSGDSDATYTLDEAFTHIGFGRYQWCLLLLCGVGYAAGTMELILITFLLPELKKQWGSAVSEYGESGLAMSVFAGSLVGSVFWGWISDRIGRKFSFVATVIIGTLAGVASAASPSLAWMIVFRCVVGFALGGNMSIDFVLFLEFMPITNRGRYLSLITLFGVGGVLMTVGIAWLTIPDPRYGWRWFLVFCTLPSASLLLLRVFASHESPRYLVVVNKLDEATTVLQAVARANGTSLPVGRLIDASAASTQPLPPSSLAPPPSSSRRQQQQQQQQRDDDTEEVKLLTNSSSSSSINNNNSSNSNNKGTFHNFALLLSPPLKRMSLLLWACWFLLTFAYYGVTIWLPKYLAHKHLTASGDLYGTFLLIGFAELPGLALATWLVNRIGRRQCMCFFMSGSAISTVLFGVATSIWSVRVCTALIYFFVVGAWSVIYIYTPEVYPTFLRSSASGAKSVFATAGGILSPLVGAVLFNTVNSAWAVLLTYAAAFLAGAVVSAMFTVETLGRPLEDRIIIFDTDTVDVDDESYSIK